jgi:MYXO-CTERM domain-containing protein
MRHLRKLWILGLIGTGMSAAPAVAQQQLVAFDIVYTATENGNIPGEKFHWKVLPSPSEPASWTTPIDYSKGTIYIHQEVMTKPSARSTQVTICFDGEKAGYGCTETNNYTTTGVHETMKAMTSTWQYGAIAWGKRRGEYHLVIKDPGLGGTPGGKPASDFVPTTMRIVMTIVPPGGTYTPPPAMGGSMTDAGTAPAADAGSVPADAGTVAADAAAVSPDATTAEPTPAADAGGSKPATKPDASAPPKEDPEEEPPVGNTSKKSGCSVGGGGPASALPLLLAGLLAAQRRRRRKP